MMRKLLIITVVVALTAGTVGCQCDWFRRGSLFSSATPVAAEEMTLCDPCLPVDPCNPCDPCAPGTYGVTPSPVLPGPGPLNPVQ